MFTIEDEERGEGIQLRFHADSIAQIMTVHAGESRDGSGVLVEYNLVDGTGGYQPDERLGPRQLRLEQHDP